MSPDPAGPQPRLRLIYRSHGGENAKGRPPYYSKLLGLASVVRSVQEAACPYEMTFWNDGPIPGDRLELMRSAGEVVQIEGGSNRASYRAAIAMAAGSDWDGDDLVWFAEDDYLYRPESLGWMMAAFRTIAHVDYLSMFGGEALDLTSPRSAPRALPRLGAIDAVDPIPVEGLLWYRGVSTTSTFGVRLSVLREDRRLLRALPYTGGSWDLTTCLTVQGLQPFPWTQLRRELVPFRYAPAATWPTSMIRGAVRVAANVCSHRPAARRRTLHLADPLMTMHMETPTPFDWSDLAEQTRAWARARGVPVAGESPRLPG